MLPRAQTIVRENGHSGHGAVLHGGIVERDALVGINAAVMDAAAIGERAIVAACAFVRAGFKVSPQSGVAGVPAKVARALGEDEMAWKRVGVPEPRVTLPGLVIGNRAAERDRGRSALIGYWGFLAAGPRRV